MRRGGLAIAVLAAAVLGASAAMAADANAPVQVGSIRFSRLAEKLPPNAVWFTHQDGVLCVTHETLKADGVLREDPLNAFGPVFVREIAGSPNAARMDRPNLFDKAADADDQVVYEIAGLVHGMDLKVCTLAYGQYDGGAKGRGQLQIEWQIYSRAKREVVATIETSGEATAKRGSSRDIVVRQLMLDSFADAVRQLGISPQFRTLLDAKPPKDELQSNPGRQERIVAQAGRPTPRSIADATGAVVLLTNPDGSAGSGVLVSTEGYVLTDAHVVALNKTVVVRWSDGYEAPGQVVRLHKKRDVALVKTDPHGRTPLPIRTDPVQVGDTVLAIGAPLFSRLQGTVTKGIVSANRIQDGFALIQSDVAVNHGNSGGPLLDEKGYVIGLTESGEQLGYGVQVGLNYFTPIKDALDFLSLDLAAAQADPPATKASTPVTGGRVSRR